MTWPSGAEVVSAGPVVVSLITIEALLSVDNALAMAALASTLPPAQQRSALRLGLLGAYLFRLVALSLASVVMGSLWLKLAGAIYLIYLMASNLVAASGGEREETEVVAGRNSRGLWVTILQIELLDLSLSLDNVVAAVALDTRLWVVCTGVFIGILALRFLAAYCIRLMERFPVLEPTAFLLIGFVGVLLLVEIALSLWHIPVVFSAAEKFGGIVTILVLALGYARGGWPRAMLRPIVSIGLPILRAIDRLFGLLFYPVARSIHFGKVHFTRRSPPELLTPQAPGKRG